MIHRRQVTEGDFESVRLSEKFSVLADSVGETMKKNSFLPAHTSNSYSRLRAF